jgi:hypothetical protein
MIVSNVRVFGKHSVWSPYVFHWLLPSFMELRILFLDRGGTRSTNVYFLYVLMHILLHLVFKFFPRIVSEGIPLRLNIPSSSLRGISLY